MKIITLMILICCVAGCCSSSYCSLDKAITTLDTVFVDQWNRGVERTGNNIASIGEYISHDVTTSPERLGNNISTIFEPVNISGTSERFTRTKDFFIQHWDDGVEDTRQNMKAIARYFCLCSDD